MNNIGIFSFGRRQSARCPDKMLRPFNNTTLTDIILKKLNRIGDNTFFAGHEDIFKEKCMQAGVEFIKRSKKSATIDGPITEVLTFLKKVKYEYLLIVNGCLPLLKPETIIGFLDNCVKHDLQPAFSVIKRNNFFLNEKREPLNFSLSLKTINTKTVDPVFEFAHALYFFKKDYFFKHGRYWDWKNVRFIELKAGRELSDIDTEEDFLIAENIWKTNKILK